MNKDTRLVQLSILNYLHFTWTEKSKLNLEDEIVVHLREYNSTLFFVMKTHATAVTKFLD